MPFIIVKSKTSKLGRPDIHEIFWECVKNNCYRISDILDWYQIIYDEIDPSIEDEDKEFIIQAANLLKNDIDLYTWKKWTKEIKKITNRSGKRLYLPLRKALTGREDGPEMHALLPIIGSYKARKRLLGIKA